MLDTMQHNKTPDLGMGTEVEVAEVGVPSVVGKDVVVVVKSGEMVEECQCSRREQIL